MGSWPECGASAASPCPGSSRDLQEKLGLSLPPVQFFLWVMAEEVLGWAGRCLCWAAGWGGIEDGQGFGIRGSRKC